MDYGIAIDRLRPGAKYLRYKTYVDLVETWDDDTSLPTETELKAAYAEWEVEQQAKAKAKDKLDKARSENVATLDVSKFSSEADLIQQLAHKIAWLEMEIRNLRGDN